MLFVQTVKGEKRQDEMDAQQQQQQQCELSLLYVCMVEFLDKMVVGANNIPSPEPVKFSLGHVLALENVAVLLSLRRCILDLDADGLFFLTDAVLHGG